jgi:hypothetical protein
MEAFDKQVRDCVVRLYKPMVVCGLDKLLTTHTEVVKLLEIVNEVADTLDLVHDVCKVTHEHLCHMSLVYSYCDFAHGHDTRMEVVCELIGTILTDEVEMSTRSIYSPTFEVLDEGSHLQVYTEHMD